MNSPPNRPSGIGLSHIIAILWVGLFVVLGALQIVQSFRREVQANRQREIEIASECQIIEETLSAGSAAGWKPQVDADPKSWRQGLGACSRWELENCTERVPLLLALDATNPLLSEKFNKTGENCSEEKAFAARFGLEAFAEHRRLLDAATEDASDDRRSEVQVDRDY